MIKQEGKYLELTAKVRDLVGEGLPDERLQEIFLPTDGRTRKADDLLEAMESEAAQFINTGRLKALLRWIKCITGYTYNPSTGIAKRVLAIRQYFFLWLLNTIHEQISNGPHEDRNRDRIFKLTLDFTSDFPLDLDHHLDHDHRHIKLHLDYDLERSLDLYIYLNYILNSTPKLDLDSESLYLAFYDCIDPNIYVQASPESVDWFDRELSNRIALVKSIEAAKIFKKVDLDRIVQRYETQQEFIKAAREGETVKPSKESIYATWCSVLDITDEMLSMSHEELERCVQYFRAVQLIIDCKEVAGRVSPEVWDGIEDRLLTLDALVSE